MSVKDGKERNWMCRSDMSDLKGYCVNILSLTFQMIGIIH